MGERDCLMEALLVGGGGDQRFVWKLPIEQMIAKLKTRGREKKRETIYLP